MSLYQSKPSVIEAIHWDGENFHDCTVFGEGKVRFVKTEPSMMELQLLAGKDGAQEWVPVPVGHWIVHPPGDLSDVWPVDAEYFAGKYEPVEA